MHEPIPATALLAKPPPPYECPRQAARACSACALFLQPRRRAARDPPRSSGVRSPATPGRRQARSTAGAHAHGEGRARGRLNPLRASQRTARTNQPSQPQRAASLMAPRGVQPARGSPGRPSGVSAPTRLFPNRPWPFNILARAHWPRGSTSSLRAGRPRLPAP